MLRNRIIFSLIYSNGFFHQSRNFQLQKVGNLEWLENFYKFHKIAFSIDELLIVNANKSTKDVNEFSLNVSKIVNNVFVPITAGGGIRNMSDAELLFKNGADKIILNTSLIENQNLIKDLILNYGSQSIVASLDYKTINQEIIFFNNDGKNKIMMSFEDYVSHVQSLNIGEILLNSIDKDGTGFGYDFESIDKISKIITVPLIIMGGAGNQQHLLNGLNRYNVNAVATANLFNFIGDGLPKAREWLLENRLNISKWKKHD